jgi:aquaporin Z
MLLAYRRHWPEYLMEAAELGAFMIAACIAAVLLFDSASPLAEALPNPILRRLLMVSRWEAPRWQSFTLPGHAVWRSRQPDGYLGKTAPWDAAFHVVFQFVVAWRGAGFRAVLGKSLAVPGVDYIVAVPGPEGHAVAFLAEFTISFLVMTAVLVASNIVRLAVYTGWIIGILLVISVTVEAPLSGMSMNPAPTFGSALPARVWTAGGSMLQRPCWPCSRPRSCTSAFVDYTVFCAQSFIIGTTNAVISCVATERLGCALPERPREAIIGVSDELLFRIRVLPAARLRYLQADQLGHDHHDVELTRQRLQGGQRPRRLRCRYDVAVTHRRESDKAVVGEQEFEFIRICQLRCRIGRFAEAARRDGLEDAVKVAENHADENVSTECPRKTIGRHGLLLVDGLQDCGGGEAEKHRGKAMEHEGQGHRG